MIGKLQSSSRDVEGEKKRFRFTFARSFKMFEMNKQVMSFGGMTIFVELL